MDAKPNRTDANPPVGELVRKKKKRTKKKEKERKGVIILMVVINPNYQNRLQLLHNVDIEDVVHTY